MMVFDFLVIFILNTLYLIHYLHNTNVLTWMQLTTYILRIQIYLTYLYISYILTTYILTYTQQRLIHTIRTTTLFSTNKSNSDWRIFHNPSLQSNNRYRNVFDDGNSFPINAIIIYFIALLINDTGLIRNKVPPLKFHTIQNIHKKLWDKLIINR